MANHLKQHLDGFLDTLATEIRRVNGANGWDLVRYGDWSESPTKIPAKLALIHSEVSEALEAFRTGNLDNFTEEMADVLIRVLDCVGGLTTRFTDVVMDKVEFNKTRGFRHGGKRV